MFVPLSWHFGSDSSTLRTSLHPLGFLGRRNCFDKCPEGGVDRVWRSEHFGNIRIKHDHKGGLRSAGSEAVRFGLPVVKAVFRSQIMAVISVFFSCG
jgi:hypothetical protein